jgi:hypothetical protein
MFYEKRFCPRYSVDFDVELNLAESDLKQEATKLKYRVQAETIAESGIELLCKKEVVDHLLSQVKRPIYANLSFPSFELLQVNQCRLMRHRRLSQDSYCLIFHFPPHNKQLQELLISVSSSLPKQAS